MKQGTESATGHIYCLGTTRMNMRRNTGRWVLAEDVPAEIGGTYRRFLPSPRFESKDELEDYLKRKAEYYGGREVFVTYRRPQPEKKRRRKSGGQGYY